MFWERFLQRNIFHSVLNWHHVQQNMPLPWYLIQFLWSSKMVGMPSHRMGRGENKTITVSEMHSVARHAHKIIGNRNTNQITWVDQAADEDFESSVLLARHIHSGHGKLYIESFGLFSSTPLESLCDLMFSSWRLKLLHPILGLSKSNANFRLSGLIVLECPPYKYLLWPSRKWGKLPPWVVTNTSLWRQTV